MKILVMGTAGSGKTTTASILASRLSIPHIELDSLFWGPDWTASDRADFRDRVGRTLAVHDHCVIDGNYRSVRDLVAEQSDLVIWLDYPLAVTEWRLARRTLSRILSRRPLWNGNRESARMLIGSRFDLFRWAVREHRRLRVEIPLLCASRDADSCFRVRDRRDLEALLLRLNQFEAGE